SGTAFEQIAGIDPLDAILDDLQPARHHSLRRSNGRRGGVPVWNSWLWAMTEWLHEGWNVIGGERCQAEACDATGVRCDYVDKRTRACRTTWCSQHWVAVAGKPYCRRHASVVAAMGADAGAVGLPDVDNRAAALVASVAAEVDARVRAVLHEVAPAGGAVLVADPVRPLPPRDRATRRWQRAWKLVDHSGMLKRVAIEVDEDDDAVVMAHVDTELIGQGVPPWIERRRRGVSVPEQVDAEQRRSFYDAIARSIELVVTDREAVPLL